MNKKFTKEELDAACDQIADEREEKFQEAQRAISWLQEQLGMKHIRLSDPVIENRGYRSPSEIIKYVIVCTYETYGPYLEDWTNKLDEKLWAVQNNEWVHGFSPSSKFYDVKTPFGDYKLTFEYFDNHCCGY